MVTLPQFNLEHGTELSWQSEVKSSPRGHNEEVAQVESHSGILVSPLQMRTVWNYHVAGSQSGCQALGKDSHCLEEFYGIEFLCSRPGREPNLPTSCLQSQNYHDTQQRASDMRLFRNATGDLSSLLTV